MPLAPVSASIRSERNEQDDEENEEEDERKEKPYMEFLTTVTISGVRLNSKQNYSTAVADVDSGLQDRAALLKQLRVNLQAAQDRMRVYANKNRT
ncbi:hypothetical protein GBA52_000390 [Prunus armeniaca]|nr:hypothetical protein GBA52_000390 [Prunus armeniaca]